jgi:hypothetical protein
MKNEAFWDVTPCGSCKNQRFGGNSSIILSHSISRLGSVAETLCVSCEI